MKFSQYFAIYISVIILICCSQKSVVKSDLEALRPGIDSVTILFPLVQYSEKSGEVKTAKTGHSIFVSRKVAEVLKETIDEGKFVSKSADIILDSTVIDEWLPESYLTCLMQCKQISDSLLKSADKKKIFPVTPELQWLISKVQTKYFIIVNGTAFGTTEETKRYDILQAQTFKLFYDRPFAYEYQWSGLELKLWIADAKTNEVVWNNFNDSKDTKYDPIKAEEIKLLCKKLLQIE